VDGFLTGNFDYWQDVGFKKVAREKSIPFIVLSREHPVIPSACDIVKARYARADYRFDGDAIAVAGQSTFDVITHSGRICDDHQVRITGLPRYDAWRPVRKDKPLSQRSYITLLTFTSGYYADETFKDVLISFLKIADSYSSDDVSFVVKTKDRLDTEKVRALANSYSAQHNVAISDTIDLFDLLPDSRLIIGYNSLSLVEGLMSGSRIAIPNWGQCLSSGPKVMYPVDDPLVDELIDFPKDEQALYLLVAQAINDSQLNNDLEKNEKLIDQFIHIPKKTTSAAELEKLFFDCEKSLG
jgi:hypothetical protein